MTEKLSWMRWNEIITSFLSYVSYRGLILLGLIFLSGLFEGFGIIMFLPLISSLSGQEPDGHAAWIISGLESVGINPTTPVLLLIIVVIFTAKGIVTFLQGNYSITLTNNLSKALRLDLAKYYAEARYSFTSTYSVGSLNNLATIEVENYCGAFTKLVDLTVVLVYVGIYVSGAVSLDLWVTVAAVSASMLGILSLQFFTRKVRSLSFAVTQSNAEVNSGFVEFLQHLTYYKITGSGDVAYRRISQRVANLIKNRIQIGRLNLMVSSTVEPVAVTLVCLILLYYLQGDVTELDQGIVLLMLFYRSFSKLMSFQVEWQRFNACIGGLFAVNKFFTKSRRAENSESMGSHLLSNFDIRMEQVNLSIAQTEILSRVDLEIREGERVGICGLSGSGKTSLIKIILGLYQPTKGRFMMGGMPHHSLDWGHLRERIGYLDQNPPILQGTVRDNVTFWKEVLDKGSESSDSQVWRALRRANAEEFVKKLGGLDAELGPGGVILSGGQAQRLALARELVKDPKLLVLDEPTSALDQSSEKNFLDFLYEIKPDATVIIISHKREVLESCQRIIEIDNGRLT